MKMLIVALTGLAVLATAVPASAEVQVTGLPKGWHVGKIVEEEKGQKCSIESGRQLVLTDRCRAIPNGGKFCQFDCIPIKDVRR